MSGEVPTIDELYWRAYCAAVLKILAPGGLGEGNAVFVAPQTQRGIAGGKFIPDVVTNNLVYNVADDLLPGTSPLYVPGGAAKYTQQLSTYLNWVKVNNNPNAGALIRLTDALRRLNITQTNLDNKLDEALDKFANFPDKSVSFEQWAVTYDQVFIRARDSNLAASADYENALLDYWGPDAGALIQNKDRLKLGTNILSSNAGYNMSCTLADLNDIQGLWEKSNGGAKPAPPDQDKLFYRPAFSVQGLGPTIDGWITMYGKDPTRITVDLDAARKTKWEDFGFTEVKASASIGYWMIFSITVTYEGKTETKNLKLKQDEKQVELELICNGIQSFPIQPGGWDTPGVKTLYPKLRDGAPQGLLTSLVRAQSLLIGYGVGAKVSFSSSVREEVHNMISETKRVNGSAKIFGWDISAAGSGDMNSSRITTFDDVRWDKESGTFEIPSQDNGYPTLLGVLGRRL